MFGDVGHGLLLVLLALFFIANEAALGKQQLDDIVGMMFGGRYVLLLNGIFAVYVVVSGSKFESPSYAWLRYKI